MSRTYLKSDHFNGADQPVRKNTLEVPSVALPMVGDARDAGDVGALCVQDQHLGADPCIHGFACR